VWGDTTPRLRSALCARWRKADVTDSTDELMRSYRSFAASCCVDCAAYFFALAIVFFAASTLG
jgi:hypothetical protein